MISEDVQGLTLGAGVDLFQLDLTDIGGDIYYFTTTIHPDGLPIVFNGIAYTAVDIYVDGFEMNGQGPFPQPTVRIANTTRILTSIVNDLDDLVGATVTRIQTFDKYLDDAPTADPSAHYPPEVYLIEQKTAQNKLYIEFKLASAIDVEGQKLPNRLIVRDYCPRIYRKYNVNNGAFDYTNATCPYDGAVYATKEGVITTIDNDKCGKRLADCLLRYGKAQALPFHGFPGAGKFTG